MRDIEDMPDFTVLYTGDYLNEKGEVALKDIGLDALSRFEHIKVGFLLDQKPDGSPTYWTRVYSLEIKPHHVVNANGLVVCRPWVKASAFAEGAENLVVIGRAGAGYDKIDLESCTSNDVAVFNCPSAFAHSTASAALTLMLALAKRLPQQESLVRTGRWDQQAQVKGDDLTGQTLGIVGLGHSGAELARLVAPFQMRVLSYSPHCDSARAESHGVSLVPTLQSLLQQSDFVSLHCRLTASTHGMLGEREFRFMKPTAYFINVDRGELVQEDVLIRSLRERWIAGAGLDVYEAEPLPITSALTGLDNVILTPHYLASTRQAARAVMQLVALGMQRAAAGEAPDSVLNPQVISSPGFLAKLARFANRPNGSENRIAQR
jgi:phosphoglycerate dehydrogenase-like enzyme